MTAATYHSAARPAHRDTRTHQFAVGQAVRLKSNFRTFLKTEDIYYITGTLPPQGASPQYRIRNDGERHERMTTQDHLEPVRVSPAGDGAALIERTFGHG